MDVIKWSATDYSSVANTSGSNFSRVGPSDLKRHWEPARSAKVDPNFKYSWDDLEQLRGSLDAWDPDDGAQPSASSLRLAFELLTLIQPIASAPEVSSLENGTVLLLWKFTRGYMSIELGTTTFGLIAMRPGFPTVHTNGDANDLIASLRVNPRQHSLRPAAPERTYTPGVAYRPTESVQANMSSRVKFSIMNLYGARIAAT
jgi:hypothetical protein